MTGTLTTPHYEKFATTVTKASNDSQYKPTRHVRASYPSESMQEMDSIEFLQELNRYQLSKQDITAAHHESSTIPASQNMGEYS